MEENNLQHEDLLIKLRAKLNEQKIKLWEPPYLNGEDKVSQSLQDLAKNYASELSLSYEDILQALHELQLHSLDRSKANAEFKETGIATLNVKARVPGGQMKVVKIQQKLDTSGSQLIALVAVEIGVAESRIKLICNGKIIIGEKNLEEQGVKNGSNIMALIMAETPEEVQKKDNMYLEMKTTRDDAMLLSEGVDDFDESEEYIKLEDQSGKAVELPPSERKALLVALALHERGRAAARQKDFSLALVLFLEADRQFNECSSGILSCCDNWALVQLDIVWCYLWLDAGQSCGDARQRLARAQQRLSSAYGDHHQRLIHLKGTSANERVLFMRLYLLQGIVAYHQNKRAEAKELLEKAEVELNALRVDETSLASLMELGWSIGQARTGLRAANGDLERAHHYLTERKTQREAAREKHKMERAERQLGVCLDGSGVSGVLVTALVGMGYSRRLAIAALRNSNNVVSDAVRLIHTEPKMLVDSDMSSDDTNSSDDSTVEPDAILVAELQAMGYAQEEAKKALVQTRNNINKAVDVLVQGGGRIGEDATKPSTSSGVPKKSKHRRSSLKHKRQMALERLTNAIKGEEDDHLNSSLHDEEEFLVRYKSLL